MKQTIKVKFPDGEREVPAYVKLVEHYLAPEPMDGWLFMREVDGTWLAYRDR